MITNKPTQQNFPHRNTPKNRALVLVLVLWILVVLALLGLALAHNTRLDNTIRQTACDRISARWLGRAGIYRAISLLNNDDGRTDSPDDLWYDNEFLFKQIPLADGHYTLQADRFLPGNTCAWGVVDEASKLNLNTASALALAELPGMTEALAEAIVNWRTSAETDQPDDSIDQADSLPTLTKSPQRRLLTIRNLLQIEGVTPELLYGEDLNLNGLLETNENDGDLTAPPDNKDGILDRGLLAYVTVYSFDNNLDGHQRQRVNVNLATAAELRDILGLSEAHANWIEENRDGGFQSIADLLPETATLTGAADIKIEDDPDLSIDSATTTATAPQAVSTPKNTKTTGPADKEKPVEPLDATTFRRIADRITTTDAEIIPGLININTASLFVLETLPELKREMAEKIIERRQTLPEGFTSVAELLTVEDMTVSLFKQIAPLITVRSNAFTIRSIGYVERSGLIHHIEAVVIRQPSQSALIYWKENR
ncbi:MAG: helix-hairpin-helix domain-containing protein [Sedimentisphaerales bacterium]|nr:helix-hairpin-helix domain-containing protein [Sedimentisphaerales bacterium]